MKSFGTLWKFRTKRFLVRLEFDRDYRYQYDGDDPNGETQAALDSGELVAFNSKVAVYLDGEEIGADYLGGSVYARDKISEFYTAHRCSDPENRNTLAQKAQNRVICHYFPGMVLTALNIARDELRERIEAANELPRLRGVNHFPKPAKVAKATLRRVPINSQGYDSSGAYWGSGQPLYWSDLGEPGEGTFFRAADREAAKAKLREWHPGAKFYN